jgi:hypothetical protein
MYFNYTKNALHIYNNYQNVQKFFPAKNWLNRYPPISKILKISYNWYFSRVSLFSGQDGLLHIYPNDTFTTFYARLKFLSSKAMPVWVIKNIILSSDEHHFVDARGIISGAAVNGISVKNIRYGYPDTYYKSSLYFNLGILVKYFQNTLLSSVSLRDCLQHFTQENETIYITDPNKSLISYIAEIIFVCVPDPAYA